MVAYAEPQDVYDLSLAAQAFVVRPRAIDPRAGDSFDHASGLFRLIGHGLTADDAVEFVLVGSGTLPGGASLGVVVYPLPVDFFRFKLSATSGGSALTFSSAGSGAWALQVDPERRLRRVLASVSADIDQDLVAHATPIERVGGRFPDKLVGIVARCAARQLLPGASFDNAQFKTTAERLFAAEERDDEQRERWRKGQPLLPAPADQTPTRADASPRALGRADDVRRRGVIPWRRGWI